MGRRTVLSGLVIALVAFNLRPAVASMGTVLPEVRAGLGLSGTATAVLTTLPVLCFGTVAPAAPRLAQRFGMEAVVLGTMVAIALGLAGRVLGGPASMFAGTVLVGGAIAIANVLLPPLVKRDHPGRTGAMMGVYTMAVSGSAAVAAGVTIPGAQALGLDWHGALAMWALPAVLGGLVWLPRPRRRAPGTAPSEPRPPDAGQPEPRPQDAGQQDAGPPGMEPPVPDASLLRSALAWQVTVFFGLQATVFYVMLAWLPSIYRDAGYSPAAAGFLLSLSGLAQIPVTLLLPGLATRAANQVPHLVAATGVLGAGLAGVLVAPTAAPYLWAALIGIGAGACFALGLALFVLRARRVRDTATLSAMAQSAGYTICAFGPLLFGIVHEHTGNWTTPMALLLAVLGPQLWCGVLAGRARVLRPGSARV